MEQVKQFTQAYSQAPWRKQLQAIVMFLLAVVTAAIIAGIYLSVTSRAATLGRQIQDMQIRMEGSQRVDVKQDDELEEEPLPIEELRIDIADLQGQLAVNMSAAVMREKAEKMGFVASVPEDKTYFKAPGYLGRQPVQLAPAPEPMVVNTTVLASAYRESLIDWMKHQANLISRDWLQEVKP
jgi:hypothetical protein